MKYCPPFDQPSNPTAPYVDLNPATGVDGSIPPAKYFNHTQQEILNVITGAGITPSEADLTQLRQAILSMIPTPTGAPSDASLMHFGVDSGSSGAILLTPSITMTAIPNGTIIYFFPANDYPGPATASVIAGGSASTPRNIVRDDGSALISGDILQNRLAAIIYESGSTRWRLNNSRTPPQPAFGGSIGQSVIQVVHLYGLYTMPATVGFTKGMTASGSQIQTGAWPGITYASVAGYAGIDATGGGVIAYYYGQQVSSLLGAPLSGAWQLTHIVGIQSIAQNGIFGPTIQYQLIWTRIA